MLVGMIPASAITAFAAEDDALTAALAEAKTYTDASVNTWADAFTKECTLEKILRFQT